MLIFYVLTSWFVCLCTMFCFLVCVYLFSLSVYVVFLLCNGVYAVFELLGYRLDLHIRCPILAICCNKNSNYVIYEYDISKITQITGACNDCFLEN